MLGALESGTAMEPAGRGFCAAIVRSTHDWSLREWQAMLKTKES